MTGLNGWLDTMEWQGMKKANEVFMNSGHAERIPFNKPFIVGKELYYIAQAVVNGQLAGGGSFTRKCQEWLEHKFNASKVLLTHSCTAALEMAAILVDIKPGDEVIMPSYTFVSTANAFVLRGGVIRFCDIRPDTLNIDESLIEALITERTKVIVPVHYAGIGCEMDAIMDIARRHDLLVVEDAAQGVNATYKGKYLGTLGHLGCYSFHETKNFISGEGGALLINDDRFIERAEIIWEKGTNRSKFFRGQVDKYTWVDIGSSFLPSEMIAAFLYAQLEEADAITERRLAIYRYYQEQFLPLEKSGLVRLPFIPENACSNGHMFYLLCASLEERSRLIKYLVGRNILPVFHYVPLHTSPMGRQFNAPFGSLPFTESLSERLLRLPCYFELQTENQEQVVEAVFAFYGISR